MFCLSDRLGVSVDNQCEFRHLGLYGLLVSAAGRLPDGGEPSLCGPPRRVRKYSPVSQNTPLHMASNSRSQAGVDSCRVTQCYIPTKTPPAIKTGVPVDNVTYPPARLCQTPQPETFPRSCFPQSGAPSPLTSFFSAVDELVDYDERVDYNQGHCRQGVSMVQQNRGLGVLSAGAA
jgi:hypothetical protein